MKRLVLVCCALAAIEARAQEVSWIDQFGTGGFDTLAAIATDNDDVYAAGRVGEDQALLGQLSAGLTDAYVRKYDGDGNEVWTRQFGTPDLDSARAMAVYDGKVYLAGGTFGVFAGEQSSGAADVYIRQYDAFGNVIWTTQFGTSAIDSPQGLTVVPTGTYVFGITNGEFPGENAAGGFDYFLAKLDSNGNLLWVRQFGTAGNDHPLRVGGIAADESGVYVGSSVAMELPGQASLGVFDAFLRKYDHEGNEVWTRQFGTACDDFVSAVSLGPDGIYIAGGTFGDLADPFFPRCDSPSTPYRSDPGHLRTYVRALTVDGFELWTRQDGQGDESVRVALALDLAVDQSGVYVTGEVTQQKPKPIDRECAVVQTSRDIRIRAYDLSGIVRWTQTFGTTDFDSATGIAIQGSDLIVGGNTFCSLLDQSSSGSRDAFVMRVEVDP